MSTILDREKFPYYGIASSIVAIFLFIFHILYMSTYCPFDIGVVIRISIIQFILAFFSIFFGCCFKSKKGKISKILGLVIIILLILFFVFVVIPCITSG